MAKAFYRFYMESLARRPWSTTIISTGVLVGTGDVMAQQFVEKAGRNHDAVRTAKMALVGFTLVGPGLRSWYLILERLVSGAGRSVALKKMVLDQTLFAPVFIAAFLSYVSTLNGNTPTRTVAVLKDQYPGVFKTNYFIWPAVQLTNFYFIPFQHRVMFVNFVSLFWNTYLAWAANRTVIIKDAAL